MELTRTLESHDSTWGGTVEVRWENQTEPGLNTIEVNRRVPDLAELSRNNFTNKSTSQSFHPEVVVSIPNNEAIEGKTLFLFVRLKTSTAKKAIAGLTFEELPESTERVPIRIADQADAEEIMVSTRIGVGAAIAFYFLSVFWFYHCDRSLKRSPKAKIEIVRSPNPSEVIKRD